MSTSGALFDELCARAKQNPQAIAFPEAFDSMVLATAYEMAQEGLCKPVLVGDTAALKASCEEKGYDLSLFAFADTGDEALKDELVAAYEGYPKAKLQGQDLKDTLDDPLWMAMTMQAVGKVCLASAGYVASTAAVVRAILKIIRPDDGGLGSSIGLVQLPGEKGDGSDYLFLADISVCPNPDAEQLAKIAISSCDTATDLMGIDATCAMLSYSTKGSASGPLVEKVQQAVAIAHENRPDLLIEGELQLDAAVVPAIGAKKAGADNKVAGHANVLIFPDLQAGNISVKLLEHYAGGKLFGAILQGFQKICIDSSRGASRDELIGTIVAGSLVAAARMDK